MDLKTQARIIELRRALIKICNSAEIYDGTPEMDAIRKIARDALQEDTVRENTKAVKP